MTVEQPDADIARWRAAITRDSAVDSADADELEEHLREQIAELASAGLSPSEAFQIAVQRLGRVDQVTAEFAREHGERLWKQLALPTSEEQAMRRRRLKKLVKRLHELRQQKLTRDQLLIKLGAARKEAGPAVWRIIDLRLPERDQAVSPETFGFRLNWQNLREARRREGNRRDHEVDRLAGQEGREPEERQGEERRREQPPGRDPCCRGERRERRHRQAREDAVGGTPAGGARDDCQPRAADREQRRQTGPETHAQRCARALRVGERSH